MSDHITQSYNDSGPMAGEPVHRNQSVWMAHWMRTSCKSATQACSNLSIHYGSKEEVHDTKKHPVLSGPEIATEIYAKGFREVTKAKTVDIIDESLTASSKRLRRERLGYRPFPMFNLSQKREGGVLALKNDEAKTVDIIDESLTASSKRLRRERLGYRPFPMFDLSQKREGGVLALKNDEAKTVDIIDESLTASSKRLRRERLGYRPFPMFNLSQKREGGVLALKNDEAKTVDIIDESLTASSKRLRRERLGYRPFPMFNLSQKGEGGVLALKNDEAMRHGGVLSSQNDSSSGRITGSLRRSESHLPSKSAWAPPETETLECRFQPGGISQYSEQQVKSHKDLEMNSLAVSTSLQDDFMRSSLKIVPHGINSRRTPLQSFMSGQEEINKSNSIMASKECVQDTNNRSHSTILVHEKKFSNLFDSRTSGKSLLTQKDATLLLHDPSTSIPQQAYCVGKQWQNMQNHSGMGLFPSQSSSQEVTESEKLYHGCYSLPRLPYSMRGTARSPSKFSQTTRHIMIAEKIGVALSDKLQIFRESTVSAKFQGKTFSALPSLSPDFRFHVQQGVKLQRLESSTESDGKENVRDVNVSVGLKNQSSAETDTMDMDAFQEKYLPGVALSPSNKYLKVKSPTSQAADASARGEMGGRPLNGELCDINQALADLPALASPVGCRENSSSRTQSLDVEHLLSHAEQPRTSKSSGFPDGPLGPEPGSRWVKRLKLSSSGSSHGTKSSKMGEDSSSEKVNKFFSKILKCGITSSEPTLGRCHGKEQMALDQNEMLLSNGESSSGDSGKKSQYVTLSHPWIQRWCHNWAASPQKKPEAVVVCEPRCSKLPSDEFQRKQFPSIAAMALMGKATRGFHPCEFRKRGSFVVWNTKGVLR